MSTYCSFYSYLNKLNNVLRRKINATSFNIENLSFSRKLFKYVKNPKGETFSSLRIVKEMVFCFYSTKTGEDS